MSEKETGFWFALCDWVSVNAPFIAGGVLAFLIGGGKEYRAGQNWRRVSSEGLMCGCFAVACITAFDWLGVDTKLAELLGCVVGFIGTAKISLWIDELFHRFKLRFREKK